MSDESARTFRPGQRIRAAIDIATTITIKSKPREISVPKDQLGIFIRYAEVHGQCSVNFDGVGAIQVNESWITDKV